MTAPATIGALAGLAIAVTVLVWVTPQLTAGAGGGSVEPVAAAGLRGLWLSQAAAVALLGWRRLGATSRDRAAGLLVLTATPAPVVGAVWLAGGIGLGAVARATGLLGVLAAAVVGLAGLLARLPMAPGVRDRLAGSAEVCVVMALWASRDAWLGWVVG